MNFKQVFLFVDDFLTLAHALREVEISCSVGDQEEPNEKLDMEHIGSVNPNL